MQWLQDVPKVELHCHLEGSTSPETYLRLAKENGVNLPFTTAEEGRGYFQFKNLVHFLEVYHTCTTAIRKPADFHFLIDQFAKSRAAENIRYCEFFVSLALHILHEVNPEEALAAIAKACRQAEIKYNIKLRCIPDISRDRDIGVSLDALKATIRKKNEYIIGFGLGGSERTDSKKFAGLFTTAADSGLRVVAHAGEWRDTGVIWDVIKHLGALRVGHGVTIMQDKELVDFMVNTQIPIEVCPTGNIKVGLFTQDTHPVVDMINAGLNVTIHSDDPVLFGTTMWQELAYLQHRGVQDDGLVSVLRRNINASFMPVVEKKLYFDELNGFLTKMGANGVKA
jgi:aminodeoxyfutalosine deaminase